MNNNELKKIALDLIRTTDYEISEMGRFIYENQKDRGHESSVEDHVGVVERYAKQLPGVVLLKAYDTDTKIDTLVKQLPENLT